MNTVQVALYARVSSEQQSEAKTIESQLADLRGQIAARSLTLISEQEFIDDGYSGATLIRPALERLRDVVAAGGIDQLYVHCPDRLARNYAHQVLLLEEFLRAGVEVIFFNREVGQTPEDQLLLQVQGMIAEYERAKIMERSRRGKRHGAQMGKVSVLSCAPYGYRYVNKQDGAGEARFEILLEEARVVRQVFRWVGQDRCSIGEVRRRLEAASEHTRTGKTIWDRATIGGMLNNPAYKGEAAFGKTAVEPLRPRLRAQRGRSLQPKRAYSHQDVPSEQWMRIPVPALIDAALFDAVQEQLQENRKRARVPQRGARYLLQGLIVCRCCGYAYYGKAISPSARKGHPRAYAYYRCIGSDAYRFGGVRICSNKQLRTDLVDEAVWEEVCRLLEHPERLEQEYQRRFLQENAGSELSGLEGQIGRLRQGIVRLIDSYADGILEKKDTWDARNIPGLRYAPHTNDQYIRFTRIPEVFRPVVKDYVKFQIAAGRAAKTLDLCTFYLGRFFDFFLQRCPDTCTLHDLSEQDIEAFILYIQAIKSSRMRKRARQVEDHVGRLEGLLCYLERIQSPVRPKEPVARIIWPHHYPRREPTKPDQVKYIPQTVLTQLDAHLHHLRPHTIPIVILLRASGWRISHVLYLKLDTCLEQDGDKYCLVGDIMKTKMLGHKIPITKEVAAVVLAQMKWVKRHYTAADNPNGWLFPASKMSILSGKSLRFQRGDPRSGKGLNLALNNLARRYQIQDDQGNIFHFRLHAFRHTKAVELINNGMSLVMVQQWMAHASPEMTLISAKILDETMRIPWEKTVQQGIVQFNDGRPEFVPARKLLPMTGENGFDPERVREHRQNVKMAPGSCLKTAKIMCKFVELPCFHCPAYVLTPEDLPPLEAYEQQILERVEIGKQAGNAHWVEVNQKNLDERVRPAIALLRQGHIVAKTDKQEREYTNEEWEQRQQNQQEEAHE